MPFASSIILNGYFPGLQILSFVFSGPPCIHGTSWIALRRCKVYSVTSRVRRAKLFTRGTFSGETMNKCLVTQIRFWWQTKNDSSTSHLVNGDVMGVACRSSGASEAAASLKSPPQTGTLSLAWGLSPLNVLPAPAVTYCLCSLEEGPCESCKFPRACEPARLQQLLYPPLGGSDSVQRRWLCYSHCDVIPITQYPAEASHGC